MIVMLHPGNCSIGGRALMSPARMRLNVGHISCMSQRPSFLIGKDFGFECFKKVP